MVTTRSATKPRSSRSSGRGAATASRQQQQQQTNKKDWSGGAGLIPGRDILGPLFLMITTPVFSIVYFYVCSSAQFNGDFVEFAQYAAEFGVLATLREIWPDPFDKETWQLITTFMAFQLLLMKAMPGKRFVATMTPKGNTPVYKANGMASYIATLLALFVLQRTGTFDPATIYDKFGNIISSMNVFAWVFCALLVVKGYASPSSSDSGTTGNVVQDFFWGMELYPRIAGWDVKQFTNCRCGMMFWAVAVTSFCYKNMEISRNGQLHPALTVSVILQLIYITKFFHWEMGYMCSMDIQHDRAGYYICWGCLVWVPAVYTSAAFYLTTQSPDFTTVWIPFLILLAGCLCIFINYDSDHQRYVFRQSNGNCTIWGHTPPTMIVAKYTTTAGGPEKQSLLLVDGWWKISRHFHYVPEILGALCWSGTALNTGFVGPYFYVIFLTILLTDRAFRDDDRCRRKYGAAWEQYCDQVPYKIVPWVV